MLLTFANRPFDCQTRHCGDYIILMMGAQTGFHVHRNVRGRYVDRRSLAVHNDHGHRVQK